MRTKPLVLIAELTHRCPLACAYCSNPTVLTRRSEELDTESWCDVFGQASSLGVRMVHFTGGEPLLRRDLEELVAHATRKQQYCTLTTSASGGEVTDKVLARIDALAKAGLRAVQVSFQGAEPGSGKTIAGVDNFEQKLALARRVTQAGLSLTTNFVLHRANIESMQRFVDLSIELKADRCELAHVQYHGWALRNRAQLLPSREQVQRADELAAEARLRSGARIELVYVMADHFSGKAKACMGGWGKRALVVAPDGNVLPCHAAANLPIPSQKVGAHTLEAIWRSSPLFQAYRGEDWMEEPCRNCAERERDHGGCRCQALAITGRATATDPACAHSPHHGSLLTLRRPIASPAAYELRRFTSDSRV